MHHTYSEQFLQNKSILFIAICFTVELYLGWVELFWIAVRDDLKYFLKYAIVTESSLLRIHPIRLFADHVYKFSKYASSAECDLARLHRFCTACRTGVDNFPHLVLSGDEMQFKTVSYGNFLGFSQAIFLDMAFPLDESYCSLEIRSSNADES